MSFEEYDVDKIWMDGDLVDWEDAEVHVLSHVIHYGSGVFEGTRCYDTVEGPAVFRHRDHYERLHNSAKTLGIEMEYSVDELIRENGLESCYIRPVVFYGYNVLGLNPSDCPVRTAIAVWPWGAYLGEDAIKNGVDTMVSSWRKHHSSQIPTTAKINGAYVNSIMASLEAILLDKEGSVAEGPGENLFMVNDETLYTPPIDSSILDGITRRSVITIAEDLGYEVVEKRISRSELYTADELFFTGTAAEVTPIRSVDDRVVGEGTRGPVTEEIQQVFFDTVEGEREEYHDWLDFV
ncbi:MAG: branched-chain amino acid transaminase [Halobacteria archaeon]|nr:branched-chain amino acid transaminase [Halobacteria archaeon]